MANRNHIIVAGQHVADAIEALKEATVPQAGGQYRSEPLCKFQELCSRRGYLEAELVESFYGWSVRYASGLQNWGLLAGSRQGDVDGTYEGAVAWARQWAAKDPDRRYVRVLAKRAPLQA